MKLRLLILFACFLAMPSMYGQQNANLENGFRPFGSYEGGNVDSVNLGNGNLHLHIPLISYPQRGNIAPVEYFLVLNSKSWVVNQFTTQSRTLYKWQPSWLGMTAVPGIAGAAIETSTDYRLKVDDLISTDSFGTPVAEVYRYALQDPEGGAHEFGNTSVNSFAALDVSGFRLDSTGPNSPAQVYDKRGTQYSYSNLSQSAQAAGTIIDANGNALTLGSSSLTDTMGRVLPSTSAFTTPADSSGCAAGSTATQQFNLPGYNGGAYPVKICTATISLSTAFTQNDIPIQQYNGTQSVITGVILPDGTSWQFTYDSYANLTRLGFPTGGNISYEWSIQNYCGGGKLTHQSRGITARIVNDGTTSNRWGYAWGTPGSVTVTDPSGNQTVHTGGGGCAFYETNTQYYQGTAPTNLLKTVGHTYSSGISDPFDVYQGVYTGTLVSVVPTSATVSWPSGQSTKEVYNYDSGSTFYLHDEINGDSAPHPFFYGALFQKDEYDVSTSPNSMLRSTITHYKWQDDSNYLGSNFLNLPAYAILNDGGGHQASRVDYGYDDPARLQAANITTQHGAPPKTLRGNLTSTTIWLNTGGSTTSYTNWYDTGMPYQGFDPSLHMTQYSYSGSFAGAYPTQTCYPQTGSIAHCVGGSYDFTTGLIASYTDQNSQTTTYSYNGMLRISQALLPLDPATNLHAEADFYYPNVTTVERKQRQDAANWIDEYVYFDGLGRPTKHRLIDPEGNDDTDTVYDGLGRIASISNPYRSTGDSTYGLTATAYDALGRVTAVTSLPGNSAVQTSYSQYPTVTVTDEAGHQRQTSTDPLGRLTKVTEPNPVSGSLSSGAFPTTYTYDVLGNLRSVNQVGDGTAARNRSFVYDSLSRLTSASNPESGTTNYDYDVAGNLIHKTDGRGVVTTHSYDALNRLVGKSYSDGTPAVTLSYDEASPWGVTGSNYTIGRLSSNWVSGKAGAIFIYDPLGRLVRNDQCGLSNCGTSSYAVTAAYDLAGHPKALNYPSGRSIAESYSSAGRLLSLNFTTYDGTAVNYPYLTVPQSSVASSWGYMPSGALRTATLGNGVSETWSYNNRLQASLISSASATQTWFSRTYDYGTTNNNGNVLHIYDNLSGNRSQTFGYDQLNRIASAATSATSGPDAWSQTFNIDPWGNLNQSGSYNFVQPFTANNRMSGYSYDTAGDLLNDTFHSYAYDGESRITTVDGTGPTYTYGADGQRSRKDAGGDYTEYVYFGGQAIAETNSVGDWSDYVFAGGQRVVKAEGLNRDLHIYGTTAGSSQYSLFYFPGAAGLNGYTIRSGDRLYLTQFQDAGSKGGLILIFSDGSSSGWNVKDQDGYWLNDDQAQNATHVRSVDLSGLAGKIITQVVVNNESDTTAGNWNIYFDNIALVAVDGTVTPIYTGQTSSPISSFTGTSGESGLGSTIDTNGGKATHPSDTTTYYTADHLGSSRLLTSGTGYAIWSGTFLPFGHEWNPQITMNHQKFTGKERDTESGNDYFGARYYASSMGRFVSPDPSGLLAQKPQNPQSWNLYTYALNNPIINLDPSGLDCVYANDAGNGVESIDHASNSGECGSNGGTWAPGYVDENWAHFNNNTDMFQVGSVDGAGSGATVDYTNFAAGAQTDADGNCTSGCGGYGFSSASADWLQGQLRGNSMSGGLDGYIQFLTGREESLAGGFLNQLISGPLDPSKDRWAGPGGFGPPGGTGDWAGSMHDYNFSQNGPAPGQGITIGMYFNPTLSAATSRALIQSNNTLIRNAGGIQSVKMGLFFGVVNAFQWLSHAF